MSPAEPELRLQPSVYAPRLPEAESTRYKRFMAVGESA